MSYLFGGNRNKVDNVGGMTLAGTGCAKGGAHVGGTVLAPPNRGSKQVENGLR